MKPLKSKSKPSPKASRPRAPKAAVRPSEQNLCTLELKLDLLVAADLAPKFGALGTFVGFTGLDGSVYRPVLTMELQEPRDGDYSDLTATEMGTRGIDVVDQSSEVLDLKGESLKVQLAPGRAPGKLPVRLDWRVLNTAEGMYVGVFDATDKADPGDDFLRLKLGPSAKGLGQALVDRYNALDVAHRFAFLGDIWAAVVDDRFTVGSAASARLSQLLIQPQFTV